jgi:hypothetical protein
MRYLRGVRSEDERVAYRAAEAWLSRVYRRPKETLETVKPGERGRAWIPLI